jgi:ketosteroid isomerase-like protein
MTMSVMAARAGALAVRLLICVALAAGGVRPAAGQDSGAPADGASAVLDGPDASAVRAAEIAFARTMADRDFEAFLGFIAEEAVFFAGNRPLRGRAEIGAAWRPFFDGEEAPFSWTPDVVQVLESGGMALSSGPVTAASGEAAGRFNSVWRLEPDGHWRVIFDKGSD